MAKYTAANLAALRAAYVEGARSVMYTDDNGAVRRIQYENGDEMRQRIRELERDLGVVPDKPSRRVGSFTKGL